MIDVSCKYATYDYKIAIFHVLSLLESQTDRYLFLSILVFEFVIKIATIGQFSACEIDATKIYHLSIDSLSCQEGTENAYYFRWLICCYRLT